MKMAKKDIKQYSLDEIKQKVAKGESRTKPDAPEHSIDSQFWENAEIVIPNTKKPVSLRLDAEVYEWFKAQGKGHIARMQAVLKSYYEAHK
jgi:uncharacterized protein (DUF4415 family)